MACLDTSFLLDLSGRGGPAFQRRARKKLRELIDSEQALTTTRFNVAELWVGIERSKDPLSEREAVDSLLSPLVILDFDQPAAETFGRLTAYLQVAGETIGDMDALIASVALANGQSIITRNVRHFSRIPGLRTETY